MRTDQRSLRHLLQQPLTTPAQQNWVAKLLGYDFVIQYKSGHLNRATDALSRRDEETVPESELAGHEGELSAVSLPTWVDWSCLQSAVHQDSECSKIITALRAGEGRPHYSLVNENIFYKGRIVMPREAEWTVCLLKEFHCTPTGGHSSAFRIYRRLAANVYWPGMMRQVTEFVAACLICQRNKYERKSPAGLLQPLSIPARKLGG